MTYGISIFNSLGVDFSKIEEARERGGVEEDIHTHILSQEWNVMLTRGLKSFLSTVRKENRVRSILSITDR